MNIEYPKISVIVPVYNTEKYLRRCINSILAQTFTDFELLLIDDGSKDRSSEICDEYAKKDERIKVFHKENGGVSSARNLGLDNAIGEWVCFADSDDIMSESYVQNLVKAIRNDNSLVLSNYKPIGSNNCKVELQDRYLVRKEIVSYFIENKVLSLSAPYSKLYNYNVIRRNALKFPLGIQMGEDAIFILKYLNCIDTVSVVNQCNYFVNRTEGSLSSKYYSFSQEWRCYEIWKIELLKFLVRFGQVYDNSLQVAWENRLGETFNRCLQCLYRQKPKPPFISALKILKSIPQNDIDEFRKYYTPHKLRRKLLKLLITKRCFFLYLVLGFIDKFK